MSDNHSDSERLIELRQTGEAIGRLAEDKAAFTRAVEAFRAEDAEAFQAELSRLGLLPFCRLICRWLCSKHCVFICSRLCRGPMTRSDQIPVAEWREFAVVTARLAADEALLRRFIAAVDAQDADAFNSLLTESKWERFCHQLCHFLCTIRCRLVCRRMCPQPPLITAISLLPASQFAPGGVAIGLASGPSFPPGPTPGDDKPNGVGDHPVGGLVNIKGVFGIAAPFQYKVEFTKTPAIPASWTPILTPVADYRINPGFPPPPVFLFYTRVPDGAGWYNVNDHLPSPPPFGMGLDGSDYLTDWHSPAAVNEQYYLKLTVRNAALAEFESPIVPVRVDNTAPSTPVIQLQLQTPDGKRRDLGCCETVDQGNGNLVIITLQASDANFSAISVSLLGGCGASHAIVDTGGTSLSKTYNGDVTDTGYPAPTEFVWDPWAAKIDPCCYLIYVTIDDRAVVNNAWSGGHSSTNWHSITIA